MSIVWATAAPAAAGLPPGGTFTDDDGNVHEAAIEAIHADGITNGCGPGLFCPDSHATRGEMAAFLHRALDGVLAPGDPLAFTDTADSVFVGDIAWLSATGVTRGCTETRFCPDDPVTRGEMAAFLARGFDLTAAAGHPFTDSAGTFDDEIAALYAAGITSGCAPDRFCPDDPVTRAEIASFLTRALGLEPVVPPPHTGSAGCGGVRPVAGEHSITVSGETRTYLLDLPGGHDDRTALPLVFGFHGAGGSAELFRLYGGLVGAAGENALVVHPDAGATRAWNSSADLGFFDAILAEIEALACVDVDRVFVTGHSSGGFMSNQIGCRRGDVVRAIGPVAGGGPFTSGCDAPVAAIVIHGDPDPVVPFSTGVASRDRWLAQNGCSTSTTRVGMGGVEYDECTSGEPVQWWVHDQGHSWPDFASEAIWDFLSRY